MKNISSILLLFLLISTNVLAAKPSHKKIKGWLGQSRFSITKMDKIYLLDNERAFLTHITFNNEDALIQEALVLVRPDLEEAEFISSFSFDYKIIDLNHDGISEVFFSKQFQEKNFIRTTRYIVQLHDYDVTQLYTRSFIEQKNCSLCVKESVSWEIKDLNKDKIKDIKQTYILSLSNKNKTITLEENEEELLFQNNKFSFQTKQKKLNEVVIAHNVKDRQAIKITQDFTLNDPQVACFLDFKKVKKKEKITYYWINNNLNKVLKRQQSIHPAVRYRTWMFKSIKNKKSYLGNWIVILINEDKTFLNAKEFNIKKSTLVKDENLSISDLNLTGTKHLSKLTLPQ